MNDEAVKQMHFRERIYKEFKVDSTMPTIVVSHPDPRDGVRRVAMLIPDIKEAIGWYGFIVQHKTTLRSWWSVTDSNDQFESAEDAVEWLVNYRTITPFRDYSNGSY